MNLWRAGTLFCFCLFTSITFLSFSPSSLANTPVAPVGSAAAAGQETMQRLLAGGIQRAGPCPGREQTVFVQARKLRQALLRNDFGQAQSILQRSYAQSTWYGGQFAPFSALLRLAAKSGGGGLAKHLDAWVRADPHSAMPYLLRSVYHEQKGWRIRGTRFADEVLPQDLREFHRELHLAKADAKAALERAPDNSYANFLPLWIAAGKGMSSQMRRDFATAQKRFPLYHALYRLMLSRLAPKWGGSIPAMYAFVHRYATSAPQYSQRNLLYPQLFANLLDSAEIQCTGNDGTTSQSCVRGYLQNAVHARLLQRVDEVLQSYPQVQDKLSYSLILGRILNDISHLGGSVAQQYANQFIQQAAVAMGTNTQLSAKDTSRNNFVMDRLTGDIWYRQGNYDYAEKLYLRAIADLAHTDFPSPAQMEMERAQLFLRLAKAHYYQREFRQSAIYQIAAGYAQGGSGRSGGDPHFCAALYHLGLYAQSIDACRAQIEAGAGDGAIYWLAQAHEALHQIPAAVARYQQLADSESSDRAYSAIQLSVIYAEQHRFHKMLDTLDAYPWLYQERSDGSRYDIAAAYNNRCYAKLHLGQLHAALRDCRASLHYGNLPDAYAKEQEILQRLHQQGATIPIPAEGMSGAPVWFSKHWGSFLGVVLFSLLLQAIALAASFGMVKWAILRSRLYRESDAPPSSVLAQIRRWYLIYFIVLSVLGPLRAALGGLGDSLPRPLFPIVMAGSSAIGYLVALLLPLALNQILLRHNLVQTFWGTLRYFLLGAISYLLVALGLIVGTLWTLRVTGWFAAQGHIEVYSELIVLAMTVLGWL